MYVQRVEIAGLAVAPLVDLPAERVTHFDGPPRLRAGVADAITLAFAAWDRALLADLLRRWGCTNVEITGDPLPEAAQWTGAPGLSALVEHPEEALLTVSLTLALDPPQYGRLRKEAIRDPRLVDALGDGARLVVRIGARFSPGFDALALDPLAFIVGEAAFPISGSDRPAWMTPFLRGLAGRCARGPAPAGLWAERAGSWRGSDHRALSRGLAALKEPPLGLGTVVPLPEGLAVEEGESLVPLSLYGEASRVAAGLVAAVHLTGADVVLVDDPPPGWSAWFARQAEADASPVEQVFLFGVPGGRPSA